MLTSPAFPPWLLLFSIWCLLCFVFLGKRRTQPIHICQKQILMLSWSPFSFLFFIGSAICSPGWPGIQDAAQAGFELLLCPHLHSGYGGTYPAGLICLILCSRTLQTLSKFKQSRTSKQSPHPCCAHPIHGSPLGQHASGSLDSTESSVGRRHGRAHLLHLSALEAAAPALILCLSLAVIVYRC